MANSFTSVGRNSDALFKLKIHRGEGMCLLAMDWKQGEPPNDFVGFAIEYMEPEGTRFFPIGNRLSFPNTSLPARKTRQSSLVAPFQMFRWVHFPRNPNIEGTYTYKVTPVFMNEENDLSYGEIQIAEVRLARETYPGQINVAFTRGFISSQAFADRYDNNGGVPALLPAKAREGLNFVPTHPKAEEAYEWMGLEARRILIDLLTDAESTGADVCVAAYDLNLPDMVEILERIGRKGKLRIIIDDSGEHGEHDSAETKAASRLSVAAGSGNVKRQHLRNLQHNKMIIVSGSSIHKAVGGSTNFSWRGWMVQNNNLVVIEGKKAITPFLDAFSQYWNDEDEFDSSAPAEWHKLDLAGLDASVTFSPHAKSNAALASIGDDMATARSSLFYSLAFLSQTKGSVRSAIDKVTLDDDIFVYGMSDKKTRIDLLRPDGNVAPVFFKALTKHVPEPFKSEATGGFGTNIHHKFVVIDFDKPSARVYLGSYNFSNSADTKNGENLLLIRDRAVATSYMIEALRLFDHYNYRVIVAQAKKAKKKLELKPPPKDGSDPWWKRFYADPRRVKERVLFS